MMVVLGGFGLLFNNYSLDVLYPKIWKCIAGIFMALQTGNLMQRTATAVAGLTIKRVALTAGKKKTSA
ncbi:MAG: hypothetical protein R3F53_07830 [Gammaproteobacteria bacterium]